MTLRLGIVTPDLRVGGAERLIVDLLKSWRRQDSADLKLESHVYALRDGPLSGELREGGFQVALAHSRTRWDPRTIQWLTQRFKEDRIQLVHAHLPRAGVMARWAARRNSIPVVYTEHNLLETFHPITRRLNLLTYKLNDRVVAVSDAVARSITRHSRYPRSRIRRIYNGIATGDRVDVRPEIRAEWGVSESDVILGTISNLHPRKRLEDLLRAVSIVAREGEASLRCVVIGRDDGEEAKLRRLVHDLELGDIVLFRGFDPDARRALEAFDVYVVSSLYEGLSVAMLEAMAARRPVVATAVGGNPELVEHEVTGLLVPPESPALLASAIGRLVRDPAARESMGRAGAGRVAREFSLEAMADAYVNLYRSVVTAG